MSRRPWAVVSVPAWEPEVLGPWGTQPHEAVQPLVGRGSDPKASPASPPTSYLELY